MNPKQLTLAILFLLVSGFMAAQDTIPAAPIPEVTIQEAPITRNLPPPAVQDYEPYDPLAPARAAFYSAVLPGLGQAYNRRYWKIPIAYAGLGVGIYFYTFNDQQFNRYRSIYKRRLEGHFDDEFVRPDGQLRITNDGLIRAQRFYSQNREISVLVIAGIYALNIIDANVDAHLRQFNVSEDLTVKPAVNFDHFSGRAGYVLSLNYKF